VRLWQVDDSGGAALGQALLGHKGGVRSVAFSPDGDKVLSGSGDKTLRVWDVSNVGAMGCWQVVAWGAVINSVAFRQPVLGAREADQQVGFPLVLGDESGCVSFWALGQGDAGGDLAYVGMPALQPGMMKHLWRLFGQDVKVKGAKMQSMTRQLLGQYRNQKAQALEVVIQDITPASSDSLSVRADVAEVGVASDATTEGGAQLEETRAQARAAASHDS
jgi:hypothetical protein